MCYLISTAISGNLEALLGAVRMVVDENGIEEPPAACLEPADDHDEEGLLL